MEYFKLKESGKYVKNKKFTLIFPISFSPETGHKTPSWEVLLYVLGKGTKDKERDAWKNLTIGLAEYPPVHYT